MRRKKKTLERKHRVKARLQVEELAKAGSALYLDIFADEEKIGTIEIGRGSFIGGVESARNAARFRGPTLRNYWTDISTISGEPSKFSARLRGINRFSIRA